MNDAASDVPVFGKPPAGAICRPRPAAYAVIAGDDGRVAAVRAVVRGTIRYWLPGGGALAHESPEQTVIREAREELGRSVRVLARLGQAVQYFYAGDRETWYKMTAVFVRARLEAEPVSAGEHELCWIDPTRDRERFFHACHAWAVSRL